MTALPCSCSRLFSDRCRQGTQPNNPLFLYGSFWIVPTSYPVPRMAFMSASVSSSVSERITVWFLLREELTFLTGQALRTASLTWASHIPHIIPPTSTVYFHMFSHSFLTFGSSSCADRKVVCRAAVRSSGIFLAIRQHSGANELPRS